jgi:hypothetical protein
MLASLASVSGDGGAVECFRFAALSLTSSPLVKCTAHLAASSLKAVRTHCSAFRAGQKAVKGLNLFLGRQHIFIFLH